jgi:hypothetical protein
MNNTSDLSVEGDASWVLVDEKSQENASTPDFVVVTRTLQNADRLESWLDKESLSRTFRSAKATGSEGPLSSDALVGPSNGAQIMMTVSREAFMDDLLSGFEKSKVQPRVKPFQALVNIGASVLQSLAGRDASEPASMTDVTWGKVFKQFCLDLPRMTMVVDGVGCGSDPETVMAQLAALFSAMNLSKDGIRNAVRLCALFSQQSVMALPLTALSMQFAKRDENLHVGEPEAAVTTANRLQVFVERFGARGAQLNISKVLRVFSAETTETVHNIRIVIAIDILDNDVPVTLHCLQL